MMCKYVYEMVEPLKMRNSELFKKRDLALILALIVIAGILFFAFWSAGNKEATNAVITVNGEEYKTLPLDKDGECVVNSNRHTLTVVVKDGAVGVKNADCPDKVCEQTGFIDRVGTTIVCVPAGVVVKVTGDGEVPYDAKTK